MPKTKYILRPSLRDTLRNMGVGEEMIIPQRDFRSEVVRNAARLLEREALKFTVSAKGERTGVKVTRVQ